MIYLQKNGILLVVLGFLITVLKNDKVKLGQTIIEGGLFIMILSCFI